MISGAPWVTCLFVGRICLDLRESGSLNLSQERINR